MLELRNKRLIVWMFFFGILLAAGANVSRIVGGGRAAGPALRLVLNIPAAELEVYRGDERVESYPVSVGRPGHETPEGSYRITHIVWNPWWHPPESRWARGQKPVSPGPGNPMGRAKLFFDDLYYIHGTPEVQRLGEPASHGCVRMANSDVLKLARLVQEYGAPATVGLIPGLVANPTQTRTVWLRNPVAFEVRYAVAEVRDGQLTIHPDVYGSAGGALRERVVEALVQNGYDRSSLDQRRLDALVRQARRRRVEVPVDSVLAGESAVGAAGQGQGG